MFFQEITLIFILLCVLVMIALIVSIVYQNRIKEKQVAVNVKFQSLFDNMGEGFALHEIICDKQGRPVDYKFLEVNKAFEEITGLKGTEIRNRTLKEVMPDAESYWVEQYGEVALHGKSITYTNYSELLGSTFK